MADPVVSYDRSAARTPQSETAVELSCWNDLSGALVSPSQRSALVPPHWERLWPSGWLSRRSRSPVASSTSATARSPSRMRFGYLCRKSRFPVEEAVTAVVPCTRHRRCWRSGRPPPPPSRNYDRFPRSDCHPSPKAEDLLFVSPTASLPAERTPAPSASTSPRVSRPAESAEIGSSASPTPEPEDWPGRPPLYAQS